MKLFEILTDLFFAPRAICAGCGSVRGSDENWLCAECAEKLRPLYAIGTELSKICAGCGEVVVGKTCPRCNSDKGVYAAVAAYEYDPVIKNIIAAFKFKGAWRLSGWMGGEIVKALNGAEIRDFDFIAYVPLHRKRENSRGFNQSRKLAERVSALTRKPLRGILKRNINTKQQSRLSADERRRNLIGAFACEVKLNGERVLLIDDVRSTGSTCALCAERLISAGASCVYIATFAAAADKHKTEP